MFTIGQRVFIKSTTNNDMSFWLKQARDNGTALKVTAVDANSDTWQVCAELHFKDGDKITGRFKLCELQAWQPHAAEIYAKGFNDGIRVLVVTVINENNVGGWFALALPIYRNGTFGRVMHVCINPEDIRISRNNRLPAVAVEALKRHRAIQRKARVAYVQDDGCERDGYYYARGV